MRTEYGREKRVVVQDCTIIPSSPRGEKIREELLSKIVPWEDITVSLDNFPYYIEEHTKSLLMECVSSNLKQHKLRKYCSSLKSSSNRILLQSFPGTELYRERLVSALARELQVPLLKLDGDHGCDDETYNNDISDDEFFEDLRCQDAHNKVPTFRKGDRVKYVARPISIKEVNNRTLLNGQRGEVCEVNSKKVAVAFNICGLKANEAEKDEENTEILQHALATWLDVGDVQKDVEARKHDCEIAMEVLYQVVKSQQPMIVYFPESFLWPPALEIKYRDKPFLRKVRMIFDQLPEGVVMICADKIWESEERERLPEALERYIKRLKVPQRLSQMRRLFTNVVCIQPPKDEDHVNTLVKQMEKDRLTVISEGNLKTMQKVLKDHSLLCTNLEHPNVGDMILTRQKVEKIVGWAANHYISSCPLPCANEEEFHIPHESIKLAISRLMKEESHTNRDQIPSIDAQWEIRNSEALIRPEDIGVKFDDVGLPENVKKVLYETVVLPLRRPELFFHGNLLRPCKGILLFGPPGTGKTIVAKALARESGAKFIHIKDGDVPTMGFRTFFSYASNMAPAVLFLDKVDRMLQPQLKYDSSCTNNLTAALDGLKMKESNRVVVIGTTNRPFDLDEAVVRRLPRRIYVGIPLEECRSKILKLLLNEENLESGFSIEEVAEATEGYSGSDLKNLCAAAAYRPVQEFLEQESKGEASESDGVPSLRPLNLNDFIHSKPKVRTALEEYASSFVKLRKWNEQYGEREIQLAHLKFTNN